MRERVQNSSSIVVDDGDSLIQYRGRRNEKRIDIVVEGQRIGIANRIRIANCAGVSVDLIDSCIGIYRQIVGAIGIGGQIENIEGKQLDWWK